MGRDRGYQGGALKDTQGRPIHAGQAAQLSGKPKVNVFEVPDFSELKSLRLLGKLVACQPIIKNETDGGVALAAGMTNPLETPKGQVIGVGPDVTKCKVGDVVIVLNQVSCDVVMHGKTTVPGKNRTYVVFEEDNIIGIEVPDAESGTVSDAKRSDLEAAA